MLSVTVTTVTCDSAASMSSGAAFDCGAKIADGRWTSVRALIFTPFGSGMSYSLGIGPLLASDATYAPSAVTVHQITQEVEGDLFSAWQSSATLTCDPAASTTPGSKFGCHVDLSDGRSGDVLITMTPSGRYDVSVIHLPAGVGGADGSQGSGGAGSSDSTEPDPDLSNS